MLEILFSKTNLSDRMGIILSCLCCIHCMAAPLVILMAPWSSEFLLNEHFHLMMLFTVIPTAAWAFIGQYKKTKIKLPLIIGSIGVFLITYAVLEAELFSHQDGGGHSSEEVALTVIGSLSVIVGHFLNLWNCRCKTCHS